MLKRLLTLLGVLAPLSVAADPIEGIDAFLAEHRPGYYQGLNPGVTEADLDAFEARFDVVLPAAFRLLYLWRNGHSDDLAPSLVFNLMFPPLATVAASKVMLDGMIGYDFPAEGFWERAWVPFLENGGGDHLAVVATAERVGGPVVMFYHDDPYRGERAASMDAWLAALEASMRDGSYEVDGETFGATE